MKQLYTCSRIGAFLIGVSALSPIRGYGQLVENLPTQPVGTHDLISVSVHGAPEFSKTVRVSSAGQIHLPMLVRPISAAGLLPTELGVALAAALEAEKLLVKPSVTVTVTEYRSRAITVVGAVHKPVTFQQLGPVSLTEALARAEGLLPEAGEEVLVVRAAPFEATHSEEVVERLSTRRILNAKDPSQNVQLHAGDEVRVPVAEKIFVMGSVRRPGAFRAEDTENTTVLSMLALTEGLLPYASKTAYVYRRAEDGRKEVAVDLQNILQRKTRDFELRAGDVLYVPDNKGRRLTMTTIDRIVGFGASTGSGMLIWRR
jgi:polysaccharide export outer membrane protein